MLSYQHIYHAGNLADVQKHAILARLLSYMTQKDKPISYIETHSGRGIYQLDAPEAVKTGEAAAGITKVQQQQLLPDNHPLVTVIDNVQDANGPAAYPGSPLIAASLLRDTDIMHLAELHPQENAALRKALSWRKAKVYQQDGFELALSLAPPTPRRGVLVIDPSYEIKTDYARIPAIINKLHRKWNVGVIALWYPILVDGSHQAMLTALEHQKLPKALRHEVAFPPVRHGHRMIGSGMFVVNAPFGLTEEIAALDALFQTL